MRTALTLTATATLLSLALAGLPAHAADGTSVYNQNCAMCHAPGLANSPKFGDKAAWAPRIATGKESLLKSALNGKGAMPAKGGNPKLSEEEVSAAIDHMVAAAQ
jgi:cytochrome c5